MVLVEPLWVRLVVIGGDDETAVGPGFLGMLGQAYRLTGGVRAGPGDHRHPPGGLLDGRLDHAVVLFVA